MKIEKVNKKLIAVVCKRELGLKKNTIQNRSKESPTALRQPLFDAGKMKPRGSWAGARGVKTTKPKAISRWSVKVDNGAANGYSASV